MEALNFFGQNFDKGLSVILLIYFIVKLKPKLDEIKQHIMQASRVASEQKIKFDNMENEFIRLNERIKKDN